VFNEVLANDGSDFRYASSALNQWFTRGVYPVDRLDSKDFVVSMSSLFHEFRGWVASAGTAPANPRDLYYHWAYDSWNLEREGAWDVEIVTATKVRLLGPAKDFSTSDKRPLWNDARQARWQEYRRMRKSVGRFLPTTHKGTPIKTSNNQVEYETFAWPVNLFRNWYISIGYCPSSSWTCASFNNQIMPRSVKILESDQEAISRSRR